MQVIINTRGYEFERAMGHMVGLVVVTEKEKWCNLRHHITVIIIIIIAQVKERSRHNAGDWNKGKA